MRAQRQTPGWEWISTRSPIAKKNEAMLFYK